MYFESSSIADIHVRASDTTVPGFKRLYEVVQQVNGEEESGALSHVVNDLKATIDGNMVGDVTIPQGPLSDEDASSIAASEEVLKKSFEVKQLVLPELISAGVITWEEHEKISKPVDFEEHVAKFLQFLRQQGSAAFRFVEVLDETEIYKKLADDLRKDHAPQPKSSTKMETDEAKGTMIVLCTSCALSQFESPLPRFLSLCQMVQAYVRQWLLMIKAFLSGCCTVSEYGARENGQTLGQAPPILLSPILIRHNVFSQLVPAPILQVCMSELIIIPGYMKVVSSVLWGYPQPNLACKIRL